MGDFRNQTGQKEETEKDPCYLRLLPFNSAVLCSIRLREFLRGLAQGLSQVAAEICR
jgi:hypothetical protein